MAETLTIEDLKKVFFCSFSVNGGALGYLDASFNSRGYLL